MNHLRTIATLLILFVGPAFGQSDAKTTFENLKALNGTWEGKANSDRSVKIVFRPTSGGSALMSEILGDEDMVTMFHLDNNRVLMTHYCGAGNQPRMQASASPDGKTITFSFIDGTNMASPKAGHMDHLVITMPDADHHTEDWTFVQEDGKQMKEHFDLARVRAGM
ncbi:MAG TPA: hypothetical protein VFA40_08710 [Terriglobales bacterium]|jgi:hypothetical protein|nr:hypothetical protein [Terriglobales bacterium]